MSSVPQSVPGDSLHVIAVRCVGLDGNPDVKTVKLTAESSAWLVEQVFAERYSGSFKDLSTRLTGLSGFGEDGSVYTYSGSEWLELKDFYQHVKVAAETRSKLQDCIYDLNEIVDQKGPPPNLREKLRDIATRLQQSL